MKPLELKTYPRLREEPNPVHDGWDAWRDWDNQIRDEYLIRAGKRFTDAELAAEYWSAHAVHERAARGQSCIEYIAEAEVEVWERFATLPHYWEVDA